MPEVSDKILLVDDEERILNALRRRLSREFNIVTTTNPEEALNLIEDVQGIAVIVADMQMPEMNGVELLRRVQTIKPAIRRIMLTGNADIETAISAINDGKVMRFLRKPCDAAAIKTALQQALDEYSFQTGQASPGDIDPDTTNAGEKARDAFLSMMNHELRTPLSQIIGLANLLETQPPSTGDPTSIDNVREIQRSGERMLRLVSRILEFSRLRSKPAPEGGSEPTDLITVLRNEIDFARADANAKSITISMDSIRRKLAIRANDEEVHLAVRELLSNAIKFSPSDGHISVLINCDHENAAVRIIDTGCGIPASFDDLVRQPFRQVNESYSRPFEGIGLGLALVSTVAELNEATVSLKPQPYGGTAATLTFVRSLPVERNGQIPVGPMTGSVANS